MINKFLLQRMAVAALLPLSLSTFSAMGQADTLSAKHPMAEPTLSPDGQEIAFVSGSDIWSAPASGGEAHLLVAYPGSESRPLYSPDGQYLAFTSERTGNGDVYIFTFKTGEIKRLTYDDGYEEVSGWSDDGKYVYFATTSRDISYMNDIFRVHINGGTPMTVSADRYINEFFGTPSSSGNLLAFNAHGMGARQWWRKGHSHLDESEIWLRQEGKESSYKQITQGGAKELWPMWSTDNTSLYYVSDRSGAQNLWMTSLEGEAQRLTNFEQGRVLWPAISANGKTIVFERDFGIWTYDIGTGKAAPVNITLRGAVAGPGTRNLNMDSDFEDLALAPDGKKLVFTAHGEVFAASAKDGGDATRITNSAAEESQITWAPDSRSIVYVSNRDKAAHLYQYDFVTQQETQLTREDADDASPVFSPNGKFLAFIRDGKELRTLELASKKEKLLTEDYLGRPPFTATGSVAWSPDNQWIAYASFGSKTFRNISVIPAAGGEAQPVSFIANTFGGNVSWSPDGTYLLFTTGQRTEDGQIARVDLVPRTPVFREDRFRDLFEEETPDPLQQEETEDDEDQSSSDTTAVDDKKPAKPVKIVTEGIRQRLSLLPVGIDAGAQYISPDGKMLLILASVAGKENIYTYSLDVLADKPAVAEQLTATADRKSDVQFSADGKEVYYLENGRIQKIALDNKEPKPVSVSAEMSVDFSEEKMAVFEQAWEIQQKSFYDPQFHGVDWQAVHATYQPLAAGAQTPAELYRIINLMLGELNASHSGISGNHEEEAPATGRLGLRFDRAAYEQDGALKITEVVALSPAALSGNIQPGNYLQAVNGTKMDKNTNLNQLLEGKVDKRIALTISNNASGNKTREVVVRPVDQSTEKGLLYRQWVEQQRAYVAEKSNGRLGYVHMYDMSSNSLEQLHLDLDAENHTKEGVVVDVRNNNGGFVNAYALDVLARKGYMTMTVRGLPSAPARTQLGQRALEAPTILVTNQHSLSDAEDFTEGYRTLELGKVVGEPTSGWIIYTSSARLVDGSVMRMPFIKVTDHAGENMELNPRPVDIAVEKPVGESYQGKDTQLDRAVQELLRQLGTQESSSTGSTKEGQ